VLEMMAEHMEMMTGTLTILNRKRGEIIIEEAKTRGTGKGQVSHGRRHYRQGDRYRPTCYHPENF
jgi:hypothetical protein